MKSKAEQLRDHLISTHVIDWDNNILLDRNLGAMEALHHAYHRALESGPIDGVVFDHPEDSREIGTGYSLAKANTKERAVKRSEQVAE